MNILLVTGIFPPDHGGPATYVPAIAQALRHRGHRIVAVVTLSETLDHDDAHFGFPVIRIRRRRPRAWRMLRTVASLRRLAASADVVYLNGLMIEGVVAATVLAHRRTLIRAGGDPVWERACNQRFFHGTMAAFQNARLPLKWRLLRAAQRWYTRRADALITPSVFLRDIVSGWGVPAGRIHVVHNAVAATVEAAQTAAPVKTFDLVTVGRLTRFKGIGDLIELAGDCGWSLKIIGDGPLRRELEADAARFSANIYFTGNIPQSQVAQEIAGARVLLLNSLSEGLPNAVLEAKAVGVPVVVTAVGGSLEVVRDGVDGFLVPHGAPHILRARVTALLQDEGLRLRMGAAGRRDVATRFGFEDMVRKTEAVLRGTAG